MNASALRPSFFTRSSLISSTAEAPSVTGEAFPAVIVPSAPKAGLSVASFSSEVSARGPESRTMPSSGTISGASLSAAAMALRWLASATSSCRVRGISHCLRVISMCSPMVRPVVGSLNVAGSAPLSHSTPPAMPALIRPRAIASAMIVAVRRPVMQ